METPNPTPESKTSEKPKFNLHDYPAGTLLRHKTLGFHKVCESNAWGKYTVKVADPEGIDMPKRAISGFCMKAGFPKIPASIWTPYINLCFYMCPHGAKKLSRSDHDSQLEVQICILRDRATLTKWKFVVPKQIVSGVRVDADLRHCIDLVSGEEYTDFPPVGWVQAGTSHSHNTMGAFFSMTDDESELTNPGLHIVVGGIDHESAEYEYAASIVQQKQRKTIDITDVVEIEPIAGAQFHEKVLSYINVVIEKNKSKFRELEQEDRPRGRYRFPGYADVTDENDKLTSFYRGLHKGNSDLFDDLKELDFGADFDRLPSSLKEMILKDVVESGMDRSGE